MKLYSYEVAGIANVGQSDAGQLRTFYWCRAYSDSQALKWAADRGGQWLSDLRIVCKKEVAGA